MVGRRAERWTDTTTERALPLRRERLLWRRGARRPVHRQLHGSQELGDTERLVKSPHVAERGHALVVQRAAESGGDDHRNRDAHRPQLFGQLQSRHARHGLVREEQVERRAVTHPIEREPSLVQDIHDKALAHPPARQVRIQLAAEKLLLRGC